MALRSDLQLPTPYKSSRTALPTPSPSSQPFSHDDAFLSDLSDIEITSSPPQTKSAQQINESSRKRKHWQIDEDATIVKMVLLRKLFPHRTDIDWCAICAELASTSDDIDIYQPGRVRSRFFSTMHGVANAHGISHRDLCRQLAMPFESTGIHRFCQPEVQIMSDPLPITIQEDAATRKLNDLAFNAKLREARQALDAHRPDIRAQRRASEGLRSLRSSQIPSSPPARASSIAPGFNERMAAIPILTNPIPGQPSVTTSQPPQSGQWPSSQRSQVFSSQLSESAAQLQADLKTFIQPITKQKQEWEWSDQTRGYIPKIVSTIDQNMWRDSKEIYNSAIAYNIKVQKGKKKEKLFVYENPLMTEQVNKKRVSNSTKAERRARRREGRGFKGPGRRRKKEKKVRKSVTTKGDRESEKGSLETNRRMKELQTRLAAKVLGKK